MGKAILHLRPSTQARAIEEIYLKAQEETEAELKCLVQVILDRAFQRGSYETAR